MRKQESSPPEFFQRIFRRLSLYEEMFGISRDFEIEYASVSATHGRFIASVWLAWNTMSAAYHYLILITGWRIEMFKNYIKVAFRNMIRHKAFSIINIFGIAIGMTACLLMLMYVVSETSFDNFHENKDRIFRVTANWGEEGNKRSWAASMPGIAPALKEEVPEVISSARVRNVLNATVSKTRDHSFKEAYAFYADPDIFYILSWYLLKGNESEALNDPFSVVVSEKIAKKYFGTEVPLGKVLTINENPYKITGVMRNFQDNTHLKAEILVSYSTAESLGDYPDTPWDVWGDDHNYILIKEDTSVRVIKEKLDILLEKYASKWITNKMDLELQPISDIHWDIRSRADIGPKGNYLYVYLFLSLSILILLIACFNFMNLSTARYLDRMKEVGIRKVVGANRGQLIHQFLVESLLVSSIAATMGIYLFSLLKKSLYNLLNIEVLFSSYQFMFLCGIIILLIISVGLIAGGYPALFLSRFRPVDIMKSGSAGAKGRPSFRQALVVIQYSISIILIIGTIVIYQQIDFMKNSNLGFEKEDVVLVMLPYGNQKIQNKYPVLKDRLMNNTNVISVSGAYTVPGVDSHFQMSVKKAGAAEDSSYSLQILPGDVGYIQSMGLRLVKGRDFSEEFALDAAESIILNETAVRALRLENPIGEKLIISDNREMTVIGVVQDFHVKSLHKEISPMMIYSEPKMYGTIAIKIKPDNSEETLLSLKKTWEIVLPVTEFNFRYMEDAYNNFYRTEEKTGTLIIIFTCLALLVSCLGLFGLAAFTASKRVKETGIRKVLGATSLGITVLLTKQFAKWVLISNVIAWPLAYYLLNRWLENFIYRITLGPFPFIISGTVALSIAILTVCFLTIKAAVSNPIESLRYE
jgi:putative ABC transport system permease protein